MLGASTRGPRREWVKIARREHKGPGREWVKIARGEHKRAREGMG